VVEWQYSYLLESLPPSFRLSSQTYATKLHILMNKQSRYVESMRNLQTAARNVCLWEKQSSNIYHHLLRYTSKGASTLAWNIGLSELLHLILSGLSNVGVPWLSAVDSFLQGTRVERKLQDIQLNKRKFCNDLRGAGLNGIFSSTERPQHLDQAVSTASSAIFNLLSELLGGTGLNEISSIESSQHLDQAVSTASSALFDLLSELLGKAADEERVERLLKSLSDIKSISSENYGFDPVIKLLFLLTKMVVSSSIQCHSCELLLKSSLHQLKNVIFHNNRILMKVFQGTKLAMKCSKTELQGLESICDESNFIAQAACLPAMDACPLVITVLVCILTLLSTPQLTHNQWQQIETQMLEYLKLHSQKIISVKLLPQLCEALQCELDDFRDTSLMELVKDVPGRDDDLQYIIASLLRY